MQFKALVPSSFGLVVLCFTSLLQVQSASLSNSGAVVAWGSQNSPFMETPANLGAMAAISAGGRQTVALRPDGTVVAWGIGGYANPTNVPAGLSNVVAVAAGGRHTVALRLNGTVAAWGDNDHGQTNLPAGLSSVTALAAGGAHSVALKQDGTLAAWGYNSDGQASLATGINSVARIAAGGRHSVALKQDGTVLAWGYNVYGQTTVPAGLSNVIAIAAGGDFTLALKSDGTLVGWGAYSSPGQPTVPGEIIAIAAGNAHCLALKRDGTVVAWGYNSQGQTDVPSNLNGVMAIAAGSEHSVALTANLAILPTISLQPSNQVVIAGQDAVFVVAASGSGTLIYQWRKDGMDIASATTPVYQIFGAQADDQGSYTVVISNSLGSVTSAAATLEIVRTPVIIEQPRDERANIGQTVTLAVAAIGTPPLLYQWYFNGSVISGANSFTLVMTNFQAWQYGDYSVRVINAEGSVLSSTASLPIPVPVITGQPRDQRVATGGTATFELIANGASPLEVQWLFNGAPIAGATNLTLSLSDVVMSQSGTYSATVRNSVGTVTSSNAALIVVTPARLTIQRFSGYAVLTLQGTAGHNYVVQSGTTSDDWADMVNFNTLVGTSQTFLDQRPSTDPFRFYRAIDR